MENQTITLSKITNGYEFQNLCNAILSFEEPNTRTFAREGRDGGIDAISEDGNTVYQFKFHHLGGSLSRTITDAKDESAKIASHLNNTTKYSNIWSGVRRWVLITNFKVNAADNEKWNNSIKPLFLVDNIDAVIWDGSKIETLLNKFPHLISVHFGGSLRLFLTLEEGAEEKIANLKDMRLQKLVGRNVEMALAKNFLESKNQFLLITGVGGVGKTRLLGEIGKLALDNKLVHDVLWGNTEAMLADPRWTLGVNSERNALLIIDDPEDPKFMRLLIEQFRGSNSHFKNWKVAIATRSKNSGSISALFNSPSFDPHVINLGPLESNFAMKLATSVIESRLPIEIIKNKASIKTVANNIVKAIGGVPLWIELASSKVVDEGEVNPISLAIASNKIMDVHISSALENCNELLTHAESSTLLEWLALLGDFKLGDEQILNFLKIKCGLTEIRTVSRALVRLKEYGLIREKRGHARISPDIVRDFILIRWLVEKVESRYIPTVAAIELATVVATDTSSREAAFLCRQLARFEYSLSSSDQPLQLLDPIIDEISRISKTGNTYEQLRMVELFKEIGFARPKDLCDVTIQLIKANPVASPRQYSLGNNKFIYKDEVLLKLAEMVGIAAPFVSDPTIKKRIVEVFFRIGNEECRMKFEGKQIPNDNLRAVGRVLSLTAGAHPTGSDYNSTLEGFLFSLFDKIESLDKFEISTLSAFAKALLPVSRMFDTYSENTLTMNGYNIGKTSSQQISREKIRDEMIRKLCREGFEQSIRHIFWDILDEYITSSNQARLGGLLGMVPDASWADDVSTTMRLVRNLIEQNASENKDDVRYARKIWDWFVRFEDTDRDRSIQGMPNQSILESARKLEEIYMDSLGEPEFSSLFEWGEPVQESAGIIIANRIAACTSVPDISAILCKIALAASNTEQIQVLSYVGNNLNDQIQQSEILKEFIFNSVVSQNIWEKAFARGLFSSWYDIAKNENGAPIALQVLEDLLNSVEGDLDKWDLVKHIYYKTRNPTVEELEFIITYRKEITTISSLSYIQVLGPFFRVHWQVCSKEVDNIWETLLASEKSDGFQILVEGLANSFFAIKGKGSFPTELFLWLLNKSSEVPDLDNLGHMIEYNLDSLFRRCEKRLSAKDLLGYMIRRIKHFEDSMSKTQGVDSPENNWIIFPTRFHLATYFETIEQDPSDAQHSDILYLMRLRDSHWRISIHFNEFLGHVDPTGTFVAKTAIQALKSLDRSASIEEIIKWSRYARSYGINSPPWRSIAEAACKFAIDLDSKEKISLFSSLTPETQSHFWTGGIGKIPSFAVAEVESAQKILELEKGQLLEDFFSWRLDYANEMLKHFTSFSDDEEA